MSYSVVDQLSYETKVLLNNPINSELAVRPHKRPSFSRHPVSPEHVLKSFNTRAFKREQPENPELMLRIIGRSVACNEPVPFVLYWGKGPRASLAKPEFKCLDYLASLADRVSKSYRSGAAITIVYTDTHAELNGHAAQSIRAYYTELTVAARQRGFDTRLLSELLDSNLAIEPQEPAATVPEDLLPTLRACASKWFRGDGTIEEGATRYYQLNMIEKQVVERAFLQAIFITFNGSEMRSLFPSQLPIFYMYSVRHGVCDKPWFLPADCPSQNTSSD